MPTRVITLPIKCSTIKKVRDILDYIIFKELVIAVIAFATWDVTVLRRVLLAPYSFYPDYNNAIYACLVAIAGVTALVIVVAAWIYDNFPCFKCIEDGLP